VAASAAAAALVGVAASTGASASTTTTTPNLSGVTLNVADQLNQYQTAFASAGLSNTPYKIVWSNFIGGPPVVAAETGGSVDLGAMAETPTVFAQAAGDPIKVVAVSEGTKPGTVSPYAIMVAPGSPIKTVAQLKGHTIAVQEGTVFQYVLYRMLAKAGVPYSAVTIDNLSITAGDTALESGAVDAYVTSYPFVAELQQANKGKILASGAGSTLYLSYLTASESALDNPAKAAAIADFVKRFHEAQVYNNAHPATAAANYQKEYGVTPTVAAATVAHAPSIASPIDTTIVAYQQAEANALFKIGAVPSKVNVVNIFDTRYNKQVEAFLATVK